ncbi:MAG: hypothetical protein NWE89_12595 [Candidatus Bathyarchaeota archaeon]|nr:hypothetical protein [Candidatus Bathyarchaeota archaeon]
MWLDENCMVVNFLQKIQTAIPSEEDIESGQIEYYPEISPREVPDYLKTISPQDLASEYVTFIQTEFPDPEIQPSYNMFDLFLRSKGLDERFGLPFEIEMKISKARALFSMEQEKEREQERQTRMELERAELPSYVDRFGDWLFERGLDKARLVDVRRFTSEYELDLLADTERDILEKMQLRLENQYLERIKQEREELSSLVDQCIDWARAIGLSRLTKADCDTFLMDLDLEILKETKNSLYSLSNTRLKSKK